MSGDPTSPRCGIRSDPGYALAYTNRGNVHKERGDYDRAIGDYGEAIRINPKSDVAFLRRSEAWTMKPSGE